jgi:SAM-dependent methyltransferase
LARALTQADDLRRWAPATLRTREPILAVLRQVLPVTGLVLEVASGTGEHAVHFARALPALRWQPTDPEPEALRSITAWASAERLPNLLPPLDLDAASDAWPVDAVEAVVCINMVHISPWEATEGLIRGAGRILATGGPLYLYGPFRRPGEPLQPSNAAFDMGLKLTDPRWGLRELDAVEVCAATNGLVLERVVAMPANNLSLVFRSGSSAGQSDYRRP